MTKGWDRHRDEVDLIDLHYRRNHTLGALEAWFRDFSLHICVTERFETKPLALPNVWWPVM